MSWPTPRYPRIPASGRGAIIVSGENISLNQSTLSSFSSTRRGGTIDLQAGNRINLTDTFVNAGAAFFNGNFGGTITLSARYVSINGSVIVSNAEGDGGVISITGRSVVSFNNTSLTANGNFGSGGTILINGGSRFTSQHSTISAATFPESSFFGNGNGDTIHIEANKIVLTDTQVHDLCFLS